MSVHHFAWLLAHSLCLHSEFTSLLQKHTLRVLPAARQAHLHVEALQAYLCVEGLQLMT